MNNETLKNCQVTKVDISPVDTILEEVHFRFGEHIYEAGERSPELIIQILAQMVAIEREKAEFYKQLRESVR